MMTAAELIVARVLMAVADDEENLAGLKDSMFEIINEMVKDCWAEKTAKTEAEKETAVNQLKAFVAMFFEPENGHKAVPMAGGTKTKPAARNTSRKAGEREQRIYALCGGVHAGNAFGYARKAPGDFRQTDKIPGGPGRIFETEGAEPWITKNCMRT